MKRAPNGRSTPKHANPTPADSRFLEEMRAASTVHLVCWSCRFAWDWVSPVVAVGTNGNQPAGGLTLHNECPVCGAVNEKYVDYQAIAANGVQMSGVTLDGLRLALQSVIDHLHDGTLSADAAAEQIASLPTMSRFGQWLSRHQLSVNAAIAAITLVLSGISTVAALAALAPSEPQITPDQIEEIISGVIERLETDDVDPSMTPAPTTPAP